MLLQTFLLDLFASIALISATMVIVSTNPIHSVVFLILVFCNAAGLLLLVKIEFIAMMFLIIYVGAIAVLFLFAVMMLDAKLQNLARNIFRYLPVGFLFALGFLAPVLHQLSLITHQDTNLFSRNNYVNWFDLLDSTSDVEVYGQVLYSYFVLQFLVVGLILLVVLIGVVSLTNTYTSNRAVDQSTYKQLSVSSKFFY